MSILKSKAFWLSLGIAFVAIAIVARVPSVRKIVTGQA